ncbi:Cysteine-rich secretory family protein [Acanthocheilonema viteae]
MLLFIVFAAIIVVVESQMTEEQREIILRCHNDARSRAIRGELKNKDGIFMPHGRNMLEMTWNYELEDSAQKTAELIEFSPKDIIEKIGENVHFHSMIEGVTIEDMTSIISRAACESWEAEHRELHQDNSSNRFNPLNNSASHFTQMIWGETHEIGCGMAQYKLKLDFMQFVCHYRPRGNIPNELIYELGEPCKDDNDCRCLR